VTTVLVLQPSATNPLGPMEQWLIDAGATLRTVRPWAEDTVPSELTGIDAVVCLGGEMDADDDAAHPWLAPVRALLADAVRQRIPVMAICLGAQLLALATGGAVHPMANGPEIGIRLVAKRDAAAMDPLLATLPFTPDVMQFHNAEVSRLPGNATVLAVSEHCPNQAFRIGPSAWGLQFHIETTAELVREWMACSPEVADTLGDLEQGHRDVAETWAPIVTRFVELAASDFRGRPDLPLLGGS
jgi:GMP synthase-like glutamine amidotransferase